MFNAIFKRVSGWGSIMDQFSGEHVFSYCVCPENSAMVRVRSFKSSGNAFNVLHRLVKEMEHAVPVRNHIEYSFVGCGVLWQSVVQCIDKEPMETRCCCASEYKGCCIVLDFLFRGEQLLMKMNAVIKSFADNLMLDNLIDESSYISIGCKTIHVIPQFPLIFRYDSDDSSLIYSGGSMYVSLLLSEFGTKMQQYSASDSFLQLVSSGSLVDATSFSRYTLPGTGVAIFYDFIIFGLTASMLVYSEDSNFSIQSVSDMFRFEVLENV